MSLIDEAQMHVYDEKEAEKGLGAAVPSTDDIPEPEYGGFTMPDLGFLKARTGAGSIETYLDHPLNRTHSHGVAQILRGVTGLAGDLDLAVVDIGLGVLQVMKERKAAPVESL